MNIRPPPLPELGDACRVVFLLWVSEDIQTEEDNQKHKHCVILKCCKNQHEDS